MENGGEFEYYDFKNKVLKDLYTDEEIRRICGVDKYMSYKLEENNNLNNIKIINVIIMAIMLVLIVFLIYLITKRKSYLITKYKIIEMKNFSSY